MTLVAMNFDHEMAAELIRGHQERLRKFAKDSWDAHEEAHSLSGAIVNLRIKLLRREAEIEMLKELLMKCESR